MRYCDRTYGEPRLISRGRPEIRLDSCDAVEFCTSRLGIVPDAKQAEVLRSTAKRGVLNCARQWGKSTIMAAKAVHRAWTRAGSLVLFASPTERQSAELLAKAAGMVRALGVKPKGDGRNAQSLLFPNGSRIVALPGTEGNVRGFSAVSMLLIDEASRVPDAHYAALLPMLLVGDGDLWLMSTPYGKRGFFYDTFAYGSGDWHKVTATVKENPRIRAEQTERLRADLGAARFAQDLLCEFVDAGGAMFSADLLAAAMDPDLEPIVL